MRIVMKLGFGLITYVASFNATAVAQSGLSTPLNLDPDIFNQGYQAPQAQPNYQGYVPQAPQMNYFPQQGYYAQAPQINYFPQQGYAQAPQMNYFPQQGYGQAPQVNPYFVPMYPENTPQVILNPGRRPMFRDADLFKQLTPEQQHLYRLQTYYGYRSAIGMDRRY